MFIFNIKMNHSSLKKILIFSLLFVIIIVFIIVGFRFYKSISTVRVLDDMPSNNFNNTIEITSSNYTNILDDCYKNIDNYVNKKIKFTGFIYRLYDFDKTQFVLAREMVISSKNDAVIVGFLCNSSIDLSQYEDYCWVEIEGTITKGNYHGEIPVVNVTKINKTSAPVDEVVYPPDNSYVN